MVIKNINVPIYGSRLHIVMTGNFIEDCIEINKKFDNNFTKEDETLGFCQQRGSHLLVVINVGKHDKVYKKNSEIEVVSTMCHEAVHLCNYLFMDKGIDLDLVNDEPQAYLTDWFMKEIYKCYLKFRKDESII